MRGKTDACRDGHQQTMDQPLVTRGNSPTHQLILPKSARKRPQIEGRHSAKGCHCDQNVAPLHLTVVLLASGDVLPMTEQASSSLCDKQIVGQEMADSNWPLLQGSPVRGRIAAKPAPFH